jgi:hypothetical protein
LLQALTSTFTVPTTGLILPRFSANWAGIGGYSGPTSTYTVGSGAAQTIASGDPTQIDLSTPEVSTINLATPSALASDGQSFDVCVYAESCATP